MKKIKISKSERLMYGLIFEFKNGNLFELACFFTLDHKKFSLPVVTQKF